MWCSAAKARPTAHPAVLYNKHNNSSRWAEEMLHFPLGFEHLHTLAAGDWWRAAVAAAAAVVPGMLMNNARI